MSRAIQRISGRIAIGWDKVLRSGKIYLLSLLSCVKLQTFPEVESGWFFNG